MAVPKLKEVKRTDTLGGDRHNTCELPPNSSVVAGGGKNGDLRPFSFTASRTNFAELPAASVAATSDKLLLTLGTGTEVVARSTEALGRGVTLTTQATTPLAGDNVGLIPAANTGMIHAIDDLTGLRFSTRLSLASITAIVFSAGLSENVSDADPTGTAGEGALFLADPGEAVTTGLTTAQHANWILAHKVNGVDTFTATSVPLIAGVAYDFDIVIGSDFKASFYINGEYVGQGPALTDGDAINPFIFLETTADAQKAMSVRFVEVGNTYVL